MTNGCSSCSRRQTSRRSPSRWIVSLQPTEHWERVPVTQIRSQVWLTLLFAAQERCLPSRNEPSSLQRNPTVTADRDRVSTLDLAIERRPIPTGKRCGTIVGGVDERQ